MLLAVFTYVKAISWVLSCLSRDLEHRCWVRNGPSKLVSPAGKTVTQEELCTCRSREHPGMNYFV